MTPMAVDIRVSEDLHRQLQELQESEDAEDLEPSASEVGGGEAVGA